MPKLPGRPLFSPPTQALVDALKPQTRRFLLEYLIDRDAGAAWQRAYPKAKSKRGAAVSGSRTLQEDDTAAALAAIEGELLANAKVSAESVIRELARIGFSDLRRVVKWGKNGVDLRESDELSSDDAAVVAEVSETSTQFGRSKRVKLHDKVRALDMLGRYFRLWAAEAPDTPPPVGGLTINFNFVEEGRRFGEVAAQVSDGGGNGRNGHG